MLSPKTKKPKSPPKICKTNKLDEICRDALDEKIPSSSRTRILSDNKFEISINHFNTHQKKITKENESEFITYVNT